MFSSKIPSIVLASIILTFLTPHLIIQSSHTQYKTNILSYHPTTLSQHQLHVPTNFVKTELIEPNITLQGDVFDGYNIFAVQQTNKTDFTSTKRYLLITDMNGKIILSKDVGSQGNFDTRVVEFLNSTTILFGTDNGALIWNIYSNTSLLIPCSGHHEYEYNPNQNTIFTFKAYSIDIEGRIYRFDYINEYNLTGHLVWSLDTHSFISHTQWCPARDLYKDQAGITHSNTLFFDPEEEIFYYNPRNLNTFYKIDHKTGKIIWGLGQYGNFTLYDLEGNQQECLFFHPHAIEQIDDNMFILFDNDYHNYLDPKSKESRIVELRIDETNMTANETWVWSAPLSYYSHVVGDADRLPNGNRLGTFGTTSHPNTTIGPRLVEINGSGDIVWELNFPNSEEINYKIHRMERFRWSPILSTPPDLKIPSDGDVTLSWQTWYNCRTKKKMNGSYILYQNGTPIKSGSHLYEKFWRSTNLTFNLGVLEKEVYNFTLVITDESDHATSDSIMVQITITNKINSTEIMISISGLLYLTVTIGKRQRKGRKREER